MDLSVVVPVHNESENIESLVGEIDQALKGVCQYEIVYVDDGSSDDTPQALKAAQRNRPHMRVLRHVNCCGQSTAVLTGVRAARAPWIATLDGDGQNDPADIPALFAQLKAPDRPQGLAMVAGWRQKRQDTPWRKFSSKFANGIRSRLLQDETPDTGCGLKVFNRDVYLTLPYFDHMHRFLPALVQRAGGKVVSVQVNHRPRTQGVSKYGTWGRLWVGIWDVLGVMWLQRRAKVPVVEEVRR
ncbi:glycosyltransferase family 2 protein [Methylogaea oryzae]|uniref:Dolichol-phosphate mannosyltransferase n=1 Tax=Methylogaea oryzae TaxID=1295382 RepID=A0A8D4VRC6_9GAMM|nr:glycosyltransferase family 2 protein [Methylogaea oryzae]BBL71889.1 dolichol-phosphate mannosyltransferase [Methylogaea oryzae]